MDHLIKDIRFGVRNLLRRPGFAAVALITLALGIGANTAIFSVVNAVLLRPLPFKDPQQVVMVWNRGVEAAGGDRTPLAYADLLDWRTQSHSFESIGAYQLAQFNYSGADVPEQVRGAAVTANFLSILGVPVQLGRDFNAEDEKPGTPRAALISDRFWRSRFNADPAVVGRSITLSGVKGTIIGVAPPDVNFPSRETDIWTGLQLNQPTRRGPYFLRGIARLKPGVKIETAHAETQTMKSSFDGGNFNFNVLAINDFIVGDVRLALTVLLISVTLVLLIATVNVANLTLVRAESRMKEMSIRAALGASRGRIIAQSLTESLLLALAGGALGLFLAYVGTGLFLKLAPEGLPRMDQVGIDMRVLGWTMLVSVLSGLIFGLAPAWHSSRLDLNEALKDGGRSMSQGAGKQRWRQLLVVTELALAVMLVTGAALLVKSLWRLQHVGVGVNSEGVLTMQFALRGQRYAEPQQVRDFYSRLVEQTQHVPGVRVAAVSNSLPPDLTDFSSDFAIEGQDPAQDRQQRVAYFVRVSPDYFQALDIPLLNGRLFNRSDTADSTAVAIINKTFARRFFPGVDPVGKPLNLGSERGPDWTQIAGVVDDVKYNGLAEDVQPAIYQPAAQNASWGMALIVKSEVADPLSLTTAIREQVKQIDPELPVANIRTLDQRINLATGESRFRTTLITLFAVVALVLACVGVYGVISYSVTRRTHEFGVRVALGAQQMDVLTMVLRQALVLAVVGVALGLAGAFALTRLISNLLFRVSANDPVTFALVAGLIAAVAFIACYIPARRATKVDPLIALRNE
jgi:putative ABC transport system permease protein